MHRCADKGCNLDYAIATSHAVARFYGGAWRRSDALGKHHAQFAWEG